MRCLDVLRFEVGVIGEHFVPGAPWANGPTVTETRMRQPRFQARPPRILQSKAMRSSIVSLRGHIRAAILRRNIETDGPNLVRAGTATVVEYELDELREMCRSTMRKGTSYQREDVIHAFARYLGFVRVSETIRESIKSAIKSAIRRRVLGYEGSVLWRRQ